MRLEEQANKYRSLENWFKSAQGSRVGLAFAAELAQVNEQLTGKTLIQLGSCGDNSWLSPLRFRNKWLITPANIPAKTTVVASLTRLPIERDSVDCVIAPFMMEAFTPDKNPIDEFDRILKPMGYVIILGFNPCSFWGIALRLGRIACFGQSTACLTSSFSVKSMLMQRGYRQCAQSSFYYIPPVASASWINKLEFFNEMGKMVWPFPAGFYCYIAQKYQYRSPNLLVDEIEKAHLIAEKLPVIG